VLSVRLLATDLSIDVSAVVRRGFAFEPDQQLLHRVGIAADRRTLIVRKLQLLQQAEITPLLLDEPLAHRFCGLVEAAPRAGHAVRAHGKGRVGAPSMAEIVAQDRVARRRVAVRKDIDEAQVLRQLNIFAERFHQSDWREVEIVPARGKISMAKPLHHLHCRHSRRWAV